MDHYEYRTSLRRKPGTAKQYDRRYRLYQTAEKALANYFELAELYPDRKPRLEARLVGEWELDREVST